ncbi:MAG TPA: chemotaxis protein CheW [Kineosporiaceae bacterium]|nr:chemotaxis protein CheW [Kineosporiaceae bacterium]
MSVTVTGGAAGGSAVLTTGSDRYLTFSLGGETYALPILHVTEIMEFHGLTAVPMMPGFIRGVINLRGRVVPVVDLSLRFGQGRTDTGRRTSIIIVDPSAYGAEAGMPRTQAMGILVDAVNKVMHLTPDDVEPPPTFGSGIRTDFISGMAKSDGQFIVILDVSQVLSGDELDLLNRAGQTPPEDLAPPRPGTAAAESAAAQAVAGEAVAPETAAGEPVAPEVPAPRAAPDQGVPQEETAGPVADAD